MEVFHGTATGCAMEQLASTLAIMVLRCPVPRFQLPVPTGLMQFILNTSLDKLPSPLINLTHVRPPADAHVAVHVWSADLIAALQWTFAVVVESQVAGPRAVGVVSRVLLAVQTSCSQRHVAVCGYQRQFGLVIGSVTPPTHSAERQAPSTRYTSKSKSKFIKKQKDQSGH